METEIGRQTIRAEQVVIASGSTAVELPFLPFGGTVISSTEALALPEVPGRLVVVGAGYIGLELGTAFAKMGSTVTIVEAQPRILPQYDAELTRPGGQALARTRDRGADSAPRRKGLAGNGERAVHRGGGRAGVTCCQPIKILVTVGRKPSDGGLGPGSDRSRHGRPLYSHR